MYNIFTEHPKSVGETYFQHMKFAVIFGLNMLVGGLACLIHAIFPFLFKNTGSNFLLKLVKDFIKRVPNIEDRIEDISHLIKNKKQNMHSYD
jgi:Family of unknown function (DUF6356)